MKTKKKVIVFSGWEELKQVYKKESLYYLSFLFSLFCIFSLFFILFASPVSYHEKEKINKNGVDIALVLDLSLSMEAPDIAPTRIEAAKKVIKEFIAGLESDRVWIVLFAWKPFVSVPLSFDYPFLLDFIEKTSTDRIDQWVYDLQGTAMGDALLIATNLFDEKSEREKVIILLTDGEANKGIDPKLALKMLKEEGIKTYTIGIGGNEKTFVETYDMAWWIQRLEVGAVDEDTLKKIAEETGGKYFLWSSLDSLESIFSEIAKLEKKEIEAESIFIKETKTDMLISFLLLFFLILFFLHFKNLRV